MGRVLRKNDLVVESSSNAGKVADILNDQGYIAKAEQLSGNTYLVSLIDAETGKPSTPEKMREAQEIVLKLSNIQTHVGGGTIDLNNRRGAQQPQSQPRVGQTPLKQTPTPQSQGASGATSLNPSNDAITSTTSRNQKGYSIGNKIGATAYNAKQSIRSAPQRVRESRDKIQQTGGARARRGGLTAVGSAQTGAELRESAKAMAVRGGMLIFWLVAGLAIAKDIIDIFSLLLDFVGTGLLATVAGAPLGAAIIVLSEIIDKISGLLIDLTLVAYFAYIGGGFALRLVVMSIGSIIDMIPGINVLPLTTVSFFAAYLLGRSIKKAVQIAESSTVKNIAGSARALRNTGARAGRILKYISS